MSYIIWFLYRLKVMFLRNSLGPLVSRHKLWDHNSREWEYNEFELQRFWSCAHQGFLIWITFFFAKGWGFKNNKVRKFTHIFLCKFEIKNILLRHEDQKLCKIWRLSFDTFERGLTPYITGLDPLKVYAL